MTSCEHDRQDDVCWECKDEFLADLERKLTEARGALEGIKRGDVSIEHDSWCRTQQMVGTGPLACNCHKQVVANLERQLVKARLQYAACSNEYRRVIADLTACRANGLAAAQERDALKATLEQAREALTVAWAECLRGFCVRGEPLPRPGYPSLRETVESTLATLGAGKEAGG